MEIGYYLFASYVFLLICIILVICRYMFADFKRQKRMLNDKEKKLLRTFQTLEDAMDEFYDLVDESKDEIAQKYGELKALLAERPRIEQEASQPPAAPAQKAPSKTAQKQPAAPAPKPAQKAPPKTAQKPPAASAPKPTASGQPDFVQLFDDISAKAGAPLSANHEKILALAAQGKARAEIAKTLKITQNEVELVIGMNKRAEAPAED